MRTQPERRLSSRAWISTTLLDKSTPARRACITNYRTEAADADALVAPLETARLA